MPEMGAPLEWAAVSTLCVVSLLSFVAGAVFRRWPDRVREYCETVDGSLILLTREAHLLLITASAWALRAVSVAALLAAASLL